MNRTAAISLLPCFLSLIVVLYGSAALAEDATPLPRYDLQPGQVFEYTGSSSFEHEHGSHGTETELTVWVTGENADGSWPIVMRHSSRFIQRSADGQAIGEQEPRTSYIRFNLQPNGETDYKHDLSIPAAPRSLIPLLPENAGAIAAGWSEHQPEQDTTHEYTARLDEGNLVITDRIRSIFDEIYLSSQTANFEMGRHGMPVTVTTNSKQGYGFEGEGTGKTELIETREISGPELDALRQASDAFVSAQEAYRDSYSKLRHASMDAFDGIAGSVAAKLDAARDPVVDTPFQSALAELDKQVERNTDYLREKAEQRAAIIGEPGPTWETTDLNNDPWSTDSLRGNVAVLDFWYRGCGWCIRAMPALNRLAKHYEDKPVRILGMNTDRNQDDAEFVIEKMGLTYPTLRAKPSGLDIPEAYGVRGYPTLIVLDQEGNVQEFHVGYSDTLFEDLSEIIDGLLE